MPNPIVLWWPVVSANVGLALAQTANNQVAFQSAGVANIDVQTQQNLLFAQSAGISSVNVQTQSLAALFSTSAYTPTFVVTPDLNTSQQLVLQINPDIGLATDCSTVTIEDGTPTYNPATDENPTGYNPEGATDSATRAKRSQLDLWFCMRPWTAAGAGETIFPTTQDGDLIPWMFTEPLPSQGIYQIFMIGAPVGTDYNLYKLNTLPEFAENATGWYVTSLGAVLDCGYINCFNTKRRNYLNGVKCGNCDKSFIAFSATADNMRAALNLLDFPLAISYFDELEKECAKIGCKCGCSK
jgi:hypothetical protein